MPEANETPGKRTKLIKKLKDWWGQLTFILSVLGAVGAGTVWVTGKIAEIEQRGVDVVQLKGSTEAIRAEQATTNARFTEGMNAARAQITNEFQMRDAVDRELDARISAVLRELRARHGVITLAGEQEGTLQSRVRAAREAADTAHVAMPARLPLEDLSDL